jgi:toxin HigB-1
VRIRNFAHKGLKKLYEEDAAKGVPPDTVDKLRKMLAFLDDMENPKELYSLSTWKAHIFNRRSQGLLEPQRHAQSSSHISHRGNGK